MNFPPQKEIIPVCMGTARHALLGKPRNAFSQHPLVPLSPSSCPARRIGPSFHYANVMKPRTRGQESPRFLGWSRPKFTTQCVFFLSHLLDEGLLPPSGPENPCPVHHRMQYHYSFFFNSIPGSWSPPCGRNRRDPSLLFDLYIREEG